MRTKWGGIGIEWGVLGVKLRVWLRVSGAGVDVEGLGGGFRETSGGSRVEGVVKCGEQRAGSRVQGV